MGKRHAKPDVRERFGSAVKFRREELGLTQEGLAEKAGIHRTYLGDVERGTRNISLVNIENPSILIFYVLQMRALGNCAVAFYTTIWVRF